MDDISQLAEKDVIVGLQRIDMNTPADSVEKAAKKIRGAKQRTEGDSATSVSCIFWHISFVKSKAKESIDCTSPGNKGP